MTELDPRLKKLEIKLEASIKKSKPEEDLMTDGTILNLWPQHSLKEVLNNSSFYKKSIFQPITMTQDQFIDSSKIKNVPQEIINKLVLVNVDYRGFDNQVYQGQIVIHKDLESSIRRIFKRILTDTNFPITSVFPISMFNWHSSSRCNNSGAFDWRFVLNNREISDHSFGAAIDINPVLNPWVQEGSPVNFPYFPHDKNKRGTLHANSDVVKIFKEEGWKWGGDWEKSKDWMHFYRPEIPFKYYGKIEAIE